MPNDQSTTLFLHIPTSKNNNTIMSKLCVFIGVLVYTTQEITRPYVTVM